MQRFISTLQDFKECIMPNADIICAVSFASFIHFVIQYHDIVGWAT